MSTVSDDRQYREGGRPSGREARGWGVVPLLLGLYLLSSAIGLMVLIATYWTEEPEARDLVILVAAAGALGATVRASFSFLQVLRTDVSRTAVIFWHLLLPAAGALLALLLYLLVQAGLIAGGTGRANVYGFVAMSLLIGLFSDPLISRLVKASDALFGGPAAGMTEETVARAFRTEANGVVERLDDSLTERLNQLLGPELVQYDGWVVASLSPLSAMASSEGSSRQFELRVWLQQEQPESSDLSERVLVTEGRQADEATFAVAVEGDAMAIPARSELVVPRGRPSSVVRFDLREKDDSPQSERPEAWVEVSQAGRVLQNLRVPLALLR